MSTYNGIIKIIVFFFSWQSKFWCLHCWIEITVSVAHVEDCHAITHSCLLLYVLMVLYFLSFFWALIRSYGPRSARYISFVVAWIVIFFLVRTISSAA